MPGTPSTASTAISARAGGLAPAGRADAYPSLVINFRKAMRSGLSSSSMRGRFTSATMISPTSWLTSLKMPWDFIFEV